MTARSSESEIKCSLLWKLCRRHGWSSPVERQDLVSNALESVEQGRGKRLVDELLQESYIGHRNDMGYYVLNSPDRQAEAAYRLLETCKYSKLRIETTLSRFQQAGGFDAYSRDDVLGELDTW